MHPRYMFWVFVVVLLAALLPVAPAQAAPLCFPEAAPAITDCIDGRLRDFWEQQGGLPVFGYPLTPAMQQQSANGPITVQVFERNRLELHPTNAPPYDVQLGRLGAAALTQQGYATGPGEQPRAGCLFFEQTGLNVCEPFAQTWQRYGLELGDTGISQAESIALFGLPLTAPMQMTLADGQSRTVQWFERARFEDHGAGGVQLGLLGREVGYSGSAVAARPSTQVTVTYQEGVSQEPGGFIEVSGNQFVRFGQPVRIKGVNYYPQWRPWDEMWTRWDAVQMERELRLGRDILGINAVRILLPYDVRGDGHVDEELLRLIDEFLQIAGDLDMRVIITLFDFYNGFPTADDRSWHKNVEYMRKLVGNYVGDERIMAWDLHNEPDHYDAWKNGDAQRVLGWLGRMADEVRAVDPNHLITVGMGQYNNLYQRGPDGRRVVDYSDFISMHNYNAPDTERQLAELRTHTDKPIVLQEFGWPTGPDCTRPEFTEAQQAALYHEMLQASERQQVAGIFAWSLRDFDAGPTMRWDTLEDHYGLFRADDTLKPAAQPFAAYAAAPLPSLTSTSLELSSLGPPFQGEKTPVLIEGSGRYVKGWFRRAWENLGDVGSFGMPLSEAYIYPGEDRVRQHFAAATLEYHDMAMFEPDFAQLPFEAQVMRLIRPAPIGRTYVETMGIEIPPQPPVPPSPDAVLVPETGYVIKGQFLDFYYNFLGEWRLGKPISPEMVINVNGVDVTVQYFENGRLDWNPQYNVVQFGQIGLELWQQQCRFE